MNWKYEDGEKPDEPVAPPLTVSGIVANGEVDFDGQIMDPEWLEAAYSKWAENPGSLRYDFGHGAVGVPTETAFKDGAALLTAGVYDEKVRALVSTGTLGFGLAIRNAVIEQSDDAPNGVITGGEIVSVSIVRSPVNYRELAEQRRDDPSIDAMNTQYWKFVEWMREQPTAMADAPMFAHVCHVTTTLVPGEGELLCDCGKRFIVTIKQGE